MTFAESHEAALGTLRLFNEKADELLSSRFFQHVTGGGAIVEWSKDQGWDSLFVGPDDESMRALVLTLRLFMQDRDPISLRNMTTLYDSLPLSADVTGRFAGCRSELNAFLDAPSQLSIAEGRPLTNREILHIFVYGAYAHVADFPRQTYEGIRATAFFPLFQNSLVDVIIAFSRCIAALRHINQSAVDELRQASRRLNA